MEEQRSLYAECVPDGIGLDGDAILGPILVLNRRFSPEDYARKLAAELWLHPDDSMVLDLSGRLDDAGLTFSKMLTYANHLGLYSEEIDSTGEQIGNFPQAFTHLALIAAALNLDRRLVGRSGVFRTSDDHLVGR